VQYARNRKWICLFISSGWDHVQNGAFVQPVTTSDGKIVYDNNLMSIQQLRLFYLAHKKELSEIKIQDTNIMDKYKEYIAVISDEWMRVLAVPGMYF
jgi:hypothetical protein